MQFRIAGFPVRIEVVFLLTMAFIGFASGRSGVYVVEWLVVAGVGVLVHELGHAVAFRRFGSPAEITLHGFGGVTVGRAQPPRRNIVVSLAGPMFGFAAGAVALVARESLGPQSDLVSQALADMIFVTFAWGVLNLLPILPLDGGSVMASTISLVTGREDNRVAHVASIAVAGALAVAGVAYGQVFLAILAAFFGYQNWQALAQGRDQPHMQRLAQGQGMLLAGNTAEAVSISDEVLASSTSKPVVTAAVELATWAHLSAGHGDQAAAALTRLGGDGVSASHLLRTLVGLPGRTSGDVANALGHFSDWAYAPAAVDVLMRAQMLDSVLKEVAGLPPAQATNALSALQFGLQHTRRFPEAARVGIALYERAPEPQTAYLVARSLAADAGDEWSSVAGPDSVDPGDEAIAWLMKAAGQGWSDTRALDVDPNFDTLRDSDGFRAVRAWIESGAEGAGPARGNAATG